MITPSYGLTATERVLPRMALDFTTATLYPRITFFRANNTATVTNSSGVIVGINANLPRFDFDPTTLICKGLLIEETRTNVLLNSLIDGTSLSTQLVTVTAAARTLSFYGTGTVVLSGAHSATVVGAGAYPTRTTLTFTPSAGVLTLTVTGTVQFAQLETSPIPSSFIPTAATAVTRIADDATMTGTNFTSWYNESAGAFVSTFSSAAASANILVTQVSGNGRPLYIIGGGVIRIFDGTTTVNAGGTYTFGTVASAASTYGDGTMSCALNGGSVGTGVFDGSLGTSGLYIGRNPAQGNEYIKGHIQKIAFYPMRVSDRQLQAFSKG